MTQPLDPAALRTLLDMVGGDAEFLDELADSFLADAPRLLEDLRTAAAAGDAGGIVHASHTLKSTSASFGASGFAALCREVEAQGRAGELAGIAECAAAIDAAYPAVVEALTTARQDRWAARD